MHSKETISISNNHYYMYYHLKQKSYGQQIKKVDHVTGNKLAASTCKYQCVQPLRIKLEQSLISEDPVAF